MSQVRDPRYDPVSGDMMKNPYGTHEVTEITSTGEVCYRDKDNDGSCIMDKVSLSTWRKWYSRNDNAIVRRG